ncbi:MAG: hypothetical protein NVS1B9_12170 [Solirubrobacteraceae bacterium]
MTNATIRPLSPPSPARHEQADELAELLSTLADLGARTRCRRERLARSADPVAAHAVERLVALERHALAVSMEAAQVHNELRHARLI